MNTPYGYDLIEITPRDWAFNIRNGKLFLGSFKEVVKHAIELGFDINEINIAVNEMLKTDDNAAHFGIFKTFIFTFRGNFTSVKQAS